ncbi:MAG: hypothetical protein ACTHMI_06960 [Mucilaginibacter sp.]
MEYTDDMGHAHGDSPQYYYSIEKWTHKLLASGRAIRTGKSILTQNV